MSFHKYGKTKNSTLLGYLNYTIMGCLFFDLRSIIIAKQLVGITPGPRTLTRQQK